MEEMGETWSAHRSCWVRRGRKEVCNCLGRAGSSIAPAPNHRPCTSAADAHSELGCLSTREWRSARSKQALENFIPFEKYKRCNKGKCFVIWVASHFTYSIVMRKRVKLNSYEPLVRDKNMKFVTRSWYNKIFPFVKPFEFLKRNKIFQCYKASEIGRCMSFYLFTSSRCGSLNNLKTKYIVYTTRPGDIVSGLRTVLEIISWRRGLNVWSPTGTVLNFLRPGLDTNNILTRGD